VSAGSVRVRVATTPADLQTARALEHEVFVAEGFTPASDLRVVEEYRYLDGQSRSLMADGPHPVPALQHFPPFPGAHEVLDGERYAEVGTLAVTGAHRGSDVGLHLYRAAFQLSVLEGVTAWVAVLEQWLLEHMDATGFHFVPMGEPRHYMGGDCLAVRMLFRESLVTLRERDAGLHAWLTHGLPAGVPA
jgi:N-acyl-L-homoserine lactone synthetase